MYRVGCCGIVYIYRTRREREREKLRERERLKMKFLGFSESIGLSGLWNCIESQREREREIFEHIFW